MRPIDAILDTAIALNATDVHLQAGVPPVYRVQRRLIQKGGDKLGPQEIEDLVNIGAYVPGNNPEFDLAVQARPRIAQFLQQEPQAPSTMEQSKKQLAELTAWVDQTEKLIKAQSMKPAPSGS